jgi:hypothetical protein
MRYAPVGMVAFSPHGLESKLHFSRLARVVFGMMRRAEWLVMRLVDQQVVMEHDTGQDRGFRARQRDYPSLDLPAHR